MSFWRKSREQNTIPSNGIGQIGANEIEKYVKLGQETWERGWEILHDDGWKLIKGQDNDTGMVFSHSFSDIGKIFKVQGYVDISPEDLFNEMVIHVADSPKWNPTLLDSSVVQSLTEDTDICYNVTAAQGPGGIISSRDFVNLRHWATKGDTIFSAGCAVKHENMPPCKEHVRGENKPGGWVYQAVEGQPDRCLFMWLMNTDLKILVPQSILDGQIPKALTDFLSYVRKRALEMKKNKANVQ